ncbi:hypothetical protein ACVWZ4_001200 [Bradyrhizobium sp. USDA 4472]
MGASASQLLQNLPHTTTSSSARAQKPLRKVWLRTILEAAVLTIQIVFNASISASMAGRRAWRQLWSIWIFKRSARSQSWRGVLDCVELRQFPPHAPKVFDPTRPHSGLPRCSTHNRLAPHPLHQTPHRTAFKRLESISDELLCFDSEQRPSRHPELHELRFSGCRAIQRLCELSVRFRLYLCRCESRVCRCTQ